MRVRAATLISVLVVAGSSSSATHTASGQNGDPGPAIQRLRAALHTRDYEGGVRASDSLVRQFPQSAELAALRIALVAQSGIGLTDETEGLGLVAEAQDAADSLARVFPKSPWSLYAEGVAGVQRDAHLGNVLTLAQRAHGAQPSTEDFIALEAEAMCRMGRARDAEAFLNAQAGKGRRSARLVALRANVIVAEGKGALAHRDTAAVTRGLAVFAQARAIDTTEVSAFALDGPCATSPLSGPRAGEGYALLERAIALAPFGPAVHDAYWSAVLAMPGKTPEQQRAEIEADVDRLLRTRPDYPGTLALAARAYDRLKLADKRKVVADKLLGSSPPSVYADQVWWGDLLHGMGAVADLTGDSAWIKLMTSVTTSQREMAKYLLHPVHGSRAVLATVYLFRIQTNLVGDSAMTYMRRAQQADPAVVADMLSGLLFSLVVRKPDVDFVRQLVMQADTICRLAANNTLETYTTPQEYAGALNGCVASLHDDLGELALKQGDQAVAYREMQAAFEAQPTGGVVRMLWEQALERAGKPKDAERLYLMRGDTNAVRRLYLTQHWGPIDGFAAYLVQREAESHEARVAEVRATRITHPLSLPRLSLVRFGSTTHVTLDSLRGKIAIVNFWGVWCGPCVMETPQIQQFYDAVRSDTNIIFLTVDTRDDRETLSNFMRTRKFDYPVLLDDGWAARVPDIGGYPTTLFVDRTGKILYRVMGRSDQLVADFTLRLQLLEAGGGPH